MDNSTETKRFHIGDILTVTTGRLVSPSHMDGIYGILDWMTGESLMTHQLPRVSRECEGPLREQFPDLAEIEVPDGVNSEETLLSFLASLEAEHGTHRDVRRLDALDHTTIDPLQELRLLRPDAPIIEVHL